MDHFIRTNLGLSLFFKLVRIHLYLLPIVFATIVEDFSRLFDRVSVIDFEGEWPFCTSLYCDTVFGFFTSLVVERTTLKRVR